jgi:hypothetical protein
VPGSSSTANIHASEESSGDDSLKPIASNFSSETD